MGDWPARPLLDKTIVNLYKKKRQEDVKQNAIVDLFFHLSFRVDDGESLLADGYANNIWETSLRRLLKTKADEKTFLAVVMQPY